jgi:putative ABC transport system ATP-binding protein
MSTATAPLAPPSIVAAAAIEAVKVYGKGENEVRALDGVTVQFPKGAFSAIMGPSGSGKSTLMHCVAGLDTLTSGRVLIGDVDLSTLNERQLTQLRRDKVGFIFQAYNLVPTLNALENITLPLDLAGRKPDRAWLDNVIDTVGLRSRLKHRPSELSGGQQQRVAVARALGSQPEIIFADEPTGNLDSRAGSEILDFMRRAVRQLGQTIVMVTHDPVAASYSDHVLFLNDGRIVDEMPQPTAERVLDRMKRFGD